MRVPYEHIRHQGPVLAALGRVAVAALSQGQTTGSPTVDPSGEVSSVVPPRSNALIDDYIRWSGGQISAWRTTVPPSLFPQWGFPLMAETLRDIDYPLAKVLNGGCRIESYAPIPRDVDLHLSACLDGIDDNGRRAVLNQKLVTRGADGTIFQIARVYGIIPLGGQTKQQKTRKQPAVVPVDARAVGDWKIGKNAGLSFACLTGDFNPLHWLVPYARIAGFNRTILHGFGTLSGALERIRRTVWMGDINHPPVVDVKFTRPLRMPSTVKIFIHGDEFFVGHAPGGRAYLVGRFESEIQDSNGESND